LKIVSTDGSLVSEEERFLEQVRSIREFEAQSSKRPDQVWSRRKYLFGIVHVVAQ
jgi:hypothetical protein